MDSRRWLRITLATVALGVVLSLSLMMWLDVYGLFRDPTGRSLPIFYADRSAKVLLSKRYVPANFNALLLGPSSSVNWDPKLLAEGTGLKIYNESLEGGNATEEKRLAEQALGRGHFKVALIVIYPTMVNTHSYQDGMDKTSTVQALGSLDAYVQAILATMDQLHLHFAKLNSAADGSHEMHNPHGINDNAQVIFTVDPGGLKNLQELAAELQARGTLVVYVVPTLYQVLLEHHAAEFAEFSRRMWAELPPAPVIDLNAPEYKAFREDRANYIDGFHVSAAGAEATSRIINQRLRQILSGH